jgi:hypothetical protein
VKEIFVFTLGLFVSILSVGLAIILLVKIAEYVL